MCGVFLVKDLNTLVCTDKLQTIQMTENREHVFYVDHQPQNSS